MKAYHSSIEPLEARIAPAVFVVTTVMDLTDANHDTGSLRDALALADTHFVPGKINTIVFKLPKAAVGTENIITLAGGDGLTTKGNVNIVGPGAGKLAISGAGASGVLFISDGSYATLSETTISGLSIIDGSNNFGGGINCLDSLTLKNVVIAGNKSMYDGGGLSVYCKVPDLASVTITNSLITGNSSSSTPLAHTYGGGGISLNFVGSVNISHSIISGNSAPGYLGGGAFIYLPATGKTVSITSSQVTGNKAGAGGGLFISNQSGGKVSITGCNISGNTSTTTAVTGVPSIGGGLYLAHGASTITGSTIRGNTAEYGGGGIAAVSYMTSLTIKSSTISGNATLKTETVAGPGGKYFQGGAGIFLSGNAQQGVIPISVTSSQINDNSDGADAGGGGGVFVTGPVSLSVSTSTVSGNTTGGGYGGGICAVDHVLDGIKIAVANSTISNNRSAYAAGGIGGYTTGSVSIISSKISGNVTGQFGGGVDFAASSLTMTNDAVTGNLVSKSSPYGYGGGIFINSTSFHISGGSLTGNEAREGGGIAFAGSAGSILGTKISGNVASALGGGIANTNNDPSPVTIQIAKITGNSAPASPDVYGTSFTYV